MSKVLVGGLLRYGLGRALDCRPDTALDQVNERFARSDILCVLELQEVAFDVDETDSDRSEVLQLALRWEFQEAATEDFDAVRDAVQEQATRGL